MAIKKQKLPSKIINYLEEAGVNHEILEHRTVYTAIDAANTLKKKMSDIAKSLLVKADKDYFLVLLPADNNLDFEKLKKAIGKNQGKDIKTVKIPGEKIMENVLKIKGGALTAFGGLHKIPVIIDSKLAKVKKGVFSSGSLNHSVEIAVKDFIKLEDAILANFGIKKKIKPQAETKPKRKIKKSSSKKPVVKKKSANKKIVLKKPTAKKK